MFAEHGVEAVVLTPHVRASDIAFDPDDPLEQREMAFAELRKAEPTGPKLLLGFEIMVDDLMPDRAFSDREFALGDSSYYLIEFPLPVATDVVTDTVRSMVERGGRPLIAHAERYFECSPETVAAWRDAGALVQVDATTLTQPSTRGHRARQLLGQGLADVMAADNHGNNRSLLTGVTYLRERGGAAQADLLASGNPAAIIGDRDTKSVSGIVLKESIMDRLKRLKNG